MTFLQLLAVIRSRWISFSITLCTILAFSILASVLLPKRYTASASILVDNKGADPLSGVVIQPTMMPGYIATQVDLLQSERVALAAIHRLGLQSNPELRDQWIKATDGKGDFEAWLAEVLAKKLDVKPSRESSIIFIGFSSPDPAFSAAMANAYTQAYIDMTLEMKVRPAKQYNVFFDGQAKEARAALEAAQSRLSQFQQANGVIISDERLDTESSRLAELSTQVVAFEAAANESDSRRIQANANPGGTQEVLNNSLTSGLSVELARLQSKLREQQLHLGPQNPQILELNSNIASVEAQLALAVKAAAGSVAMTDNVMRSKLAQARVARDQQSAKVLRLKGLRDQAAVLQRDVESAQRTFEQVTARASQSNLESQTNQTNVWVVKDATPPALASSPRPLLNTAVGLFVGALVAVGVALFRESMDRRVRYESDISDNLGEIFLGAVPKPKLGRSVGALARLIHPIAVR